jgi:hypothetical protein
MIEKLVPEKDHISRFCKASTVSSAGTIMATAFMLKPTHKGLSTHWLEFLSIYDRIRDINKIRQIYSNIFSRIGANSRIAVINVGRMVTKVRNESDDGRILEVQHKPLENDVAHSEIYNLLPNCELIAELIRETIIESFSGRIE